MKDDFIEPERIRAIQEALYGFLLDGRILCRSQDKRGSN
jgi:hypothetical protein